MMAERDVQQGPLHTRPPLQLLHPKASTFDEGGRARMAERGGKKRLMAWKSSQVPKEPSVRLCQALGQVWGQGGVPLKAQQG